MRDEVEDALRSLSVEELLEAQRLVDSMLAGLVRLGRTLHHTPQGVSERRRYPRYPVNLQTTYTRERVCPGGAPAETAFQGAVVRDISRGGVRFFTGERVEVGEILTFYLPGESGVRKLFVEVMRVTPRGEQFECGGAFVGLDRVLVARRTQGQKAETPEVLVVAQSDPERDALVNLLLRQGYGVDLANSAQEALRKLTKHGYRIVLAAGSLLLATKGRLLDELRALKGDFRIIAIASASELEGPDGQALRTCDDFICEPERAQEVQAVLGRTCLRRAVADAIPTSA